MDNTLSPAQQDAKNQLLGVLRGDAVAFLLADPGKGRSTVLHDAYAALGGAYLGARELTAAMQDRHPLSLEEAFYETVWRALKHHETVIVDDFHLVANVVCCGHFYPRQSYLSAPLTAIATYARTNGKKVVLGVDRIAMAGPWTRENLVSIGDFTPADYAVVTRAYLDEATAGRLDFDKIHRFARRLNAAQLRSSCERLSSLGERIDTERFIDYLRAHHLAANVDLGEVQAVELRDLKGLDDLLDTLEANVILPFENAELAAELELKPKRGVLLAGPPGTGKTTVGRALAHRLKSKFFLVDGTVISGSRGFFEKIHQIFEAAKRSAPAIIFIDDSDVLFEGGAETGFYRYLLTILDGIESESTGRICLMMTAMNVANLPPALVRSGRIELWLETRLPEEDARAAILEALSAALPATLGPVDIPRLATATEGLSGADLKRLTEDGKVLFAYDKARGRPLRPTIEYFLEAVETVRANKEKYAEAEARTRANRPVRPPFFDIMEMAGGFSALELPAGGEIHVMGEVRGD
jgi:hypothetical protein